MAERRESHWTLSSSLRWVLLFLTATIAAAAGPPPGIEIAGETHSADFDRPPVEAELIADAAAIKPGDTFQLGVLFRMAAGWHVYWKNPGDAGLATAVGFGLPEGLRAGELRWPAPLTFRQDGDIVGYGYDRQVLLWATVTASKALRPGKPLELRVEADWLACKDKCIPGAKSLRLHLPVAASGRPANKELFATWRNRLPVGAADKASGLKKSSITGRIPAGKASGQFTIEASWSAAPTKVEWYPAADKNLEVGNVSVKTTRDETTIAFTVKALSGAKLKSELLETVLVAVDSAGVRRAAGLTVPLRGPARSDNEKPVPKKPAASQPPRCSEAKGAPK